MDLYVVLGLGRSASDGDIRRAYRRLARRFHPDINPGDREAAARFGDISRAYETLVDPDRRRRYDDGDAAPATAPGAGFAGFDFSPRVHAEPSTTFGDLFAGAIMAATDRRPRRGADVYAELTVTLEEIARPVRRSVAATRQVSCGRCAGSGTAQGAAEACAACEGRGVTRVKRGHMIFTQPCDRCGGSGTRGRAACVQCGGDGTEARSDRLDVHVPAGAPDGLVLRLEGLGHAGRHGGPPGDAHVTIAVAPHALFRRDGDDLHVDVPVAVHEAALGARIVLPLVDGSRVRLRVPPGTQTGQRFRLRERGLPSPRSGTPGDVVAEVRIMLPRVLDERAKELLREFGRVAHDGVRDARFPPAEDER